MLDNTGILVSSLMMFFIIAQAIRLDAIQPWFEKPSKRPAADEKPGATPWRRDGQPGRPQRGTDQAGSNGPVREIVPWRQRRG